MSQSQSGNTVSEQPYDRRWLAFAIILMAEVMDLLDSTIVNIAAPSIRNDIGGSYSTIQWFAAAYTLAYAIGLIIGGRMGDIFGRRRMFLIGATGFMLASVACSLSTNTTMFIIARVVQGSSGAILIPQGLGMIRAMFSEAERPKAFAMFGPVMGLSAVLGPIVAGGLIDLDILGSGWRAVFWINVPLGLAAIIGGIALLPHHERHEKITLDLWGTLLTAGAMFLLVYPLVQGRDAGWPLWTYMAIVASVVLFGIFTWHELRVERSGKSPLVIPALFRKRQFNSGLLFCALFFAMMSGLFLTLGLYCQIGLGFSPLRAGFTQAPVALGIAIGAGATGGLTAKLGRTLLLIGLTIVTVGAIVLLGTLILVGSGMTSWDFVPSLLLVGIGMGMVFGPLFNIILAAVSERETGSAAGTINAVQQFGGTLGIAIVATLFFSMIGHQAPHDANVAGRSLSHTLTSQSIAATQAQSVQDNFVNCMVQQSTARDPSAASDECNRLTESIATSDKPELVGAAVNNSSDHAIESIFTDAMKHTLWLPIAMIIIAIVSAMFLPRRAREEAVH
jgi:EmrB/QacA subfamily drug resistance transporter